MAKKTNQVKLGKKYSFSLGQIILVVVLFAALGVYSLTQSFAATKRGSTGKSSATLEVSVIPSTKSPGYSLLHVTGCGYSSSAYVTQFNYKSISFTDGWASFGSLPVNASGCIDYQDSDSGTVLRKFTPGTYTANVTQKTLSSKVNTVSVGTFVIGDNGLTQ